ncbi:MAG: hypothetical protein ACP5JU_03410, partial [Minisyncoccia bacterium]
LKMSSIKAQIILITVFTLLGGMVVLFITLSPLTHQLVSLKETTDSYQAIGNSEAGLELRFLKDFKGNEDIMEGRCSSHEEHEEHGEQKKEKGNCSIESEEESYNFLYEEEKNSKGVIEKVLSTGKKGRFERTLVFEAAEQK